LVFFNPIKTFLWLSASLSPLTLGRFHQTLCAKGKVAGVQCLAKKFADQFYQHSATNCANEICPICKVKFAKLICHSPNAIHQKKLFIFNAQKSLKNMLIKSTPKVNCCDAPHQNFA
jgi:hypothetical protein